MIRASNNFKTTKMINKVILVGRTGKEPELHETQSGKKVVRFSLATWENYKDETEPTGWRQVTEWHNIVVWGASADTLKKNLKKGDWAYVEGGIRTRSYETKDGETKYITEVVGFAKAIQSPKAATTTAPKDAPQPKAKELSEIPDDILRGEPPY